MTPSTSTTFAMTKADYWILRVVLVLAPVVYAATALLRPLLGWASGKALSWHSLEGTDPVPAPVTLQGGASVVFDGGTVWTIPQPSSTQWLLALLPALETAVLIGLGCWCLWRLLTRVRQEDPFSGHAARYVTVLALLVLGYGVVPLTRTAADFFITAPLRGDPETYFRIEPGAFAPLCLSLVLIALAECFRQGAALRRDLEGLV